MSYRYPYNYAFSEHIKRLKSGTDYQEWVEPGFDLRREVSNVKKPIIELAGPTKDGYYFLEQIDLPSEVIITNIATGGDRPFHTDRQEEIALVTERVDATSMQYEDESLGIVLCSGLTTMEHEPSSSEASVEKAEAALQLETQMVALGILSPVDVEFAQRIKAYVEVNRTLEPGGMFFMTGPLEDITILQRMGFVLKAIFQERVGTAYEGDNPTVPVNDFVMQKQIKY